MKKPQLVIIIDIYFFPDKSIHPQKGSMTTIPNISISYFLTVLVQYIFSLLVHTAALNQRQNATGKYSLPGFHAPEIEDGGCCFYLVCHSVILSFSLKL